MKDPAFLFYPGDYLRDTQTLSEKTQVAYDRIMCEHMRNICISKQQLKFFTKKLSNDEIEELMFCLIEIENGYQIEWVAESIVKRREYSESRRKNRQKKKKDMINISKTYDKHMENENENENISKDINKRKEIFKNLIIQSINNKRQKYESYKSDLKEFFEYWSEHGINDLKMRFEKEKSFGIERRLDTWFKNKDKFNNGKQNRKTGATPEEIAGTIYKHFGNQEE